jgi:hypothetical protein
MATGSGGHRRGGSELVKLLSGARQRAADYEPDVPEEAIYETIRTLNTHLARVEVLTYKELIDNAERSIGGPLEPASDPRSMDNLSR